MVSSLNDVEVAGSKPSCQMGKGPLAMDWQAIRRPAAAVAYEKPLIIVLTRAITGTRIVFHGIVRLFMDNFGCRSDKSQSPADPTEIV